MGDGDFKYLVWTDLETTGLNPVSDRILEIGIQVTDLELNDVEHGRFDNVIQGIMPLPELVPVVQEMHTANGLLADYEAGKGLTLAHAEKQIDEMLSLIGEPQEFVLAGSGVAHHDHQFLKVHCHWLMRKWFRYYVMDVGIIRRFLSDVVGVPDTFMPSASEQSTKTHRAMEDALQHLAEARGYRNMMEGFPVEG
jgi:oligoribonuclease